MKPASSFSLVCIFLGLTILGADAHAAPNAKKVKACAGLLDGSGSADTVLGLELHYDPIKLKVSRKGVIAGQAMKQTWLPEQDDFEDEGLEELVDFSGRITKVRQRVTKYPGFITNVATTCHFSGSFSDGTLVTGKISRAQGFLKEYSASFKLRAGEATGSGSLSED